MIIIGGKGSGGYNRKSIYEHLRAGTYRKDRHGDIKGKVSRVVNCQQKTVSKTTPIETTKVVCNAGIPQCPDWLDALGKKEWQLTCLLLQEKGTLQIVHPSAIEGYCAAYSRWQKAEKELLDGTTYQYYDDKTLKQKRRVKSDVVIAKDALNQMRSYLDSLGLLPKTSVVIAPPDDSRSEMEKFLDETTKKLPNNK